MRRSLLLLIFAAACGTDDRAPMVHIVSFTPEQLTTADDLADDLRIVVAYEDADGDLGNGIARVQDCRGDALSTELAIPAIAPDDKIGSHISGTLDLFVNDVGAASSSELPAACKDAGVDAPAAGETVFCVELVDAKGNVGAGDCTDPVALE